MKSVFLLSLLIVLIVPSVSAVIAQQQTMVNHDEQQCSYFSGGDECMTCEIPEGWNITDKCPSDYEMIVADYDCQRLDTGPCGTGIEPEVSLFIEGTCREYNVTVTLDGFESACYDTKVDVTTDAGRVGRIFDSREGWKSSFFYVKEDLCVENGSVNKTYQIKADTVSPQLNFAGSIRHGSQTWTTGYYEVGQDCP
ncbi:MAG: hypothetical protein ABIH52_03690 [Candidatus Aenigmatarchaeota archaeon]